MLSWLRRFPHDVIHRRKEEKHNVTGRRTSSSTTWRNKSNNSFTASIIRCASSVVDATSSSSAAGRHDEPLPEEAPASALPSTTTSREEEDDGYADDGSSVVCARAFSFRELAEAAGNFRQDKLIGEGGFGRVYKARLCINNKNNKKQEEQEEQVVAVKQLDRNGSQGNSEFVVEVLMLSMLRHPNLVRLVGYCADGEQRLLVYEYMALGSLEDHLLRQEDQQQQHHKDDVVPWRTRMRIAHGAARGLEYLHARDVIYRDLKSSNILLDHDYTPRLSDFGLARLLPMPTTCTSCSSSSNTSRVMGTLGYCAPEYLRSGKLSAESDVYSFGVLLLEIITGRRAIDTSRPDGQQSLVGWASNIIMGPHLQHQDKDDGSDEDRLLHQLLDPRLVMAMQGPAPSDLKQAVGLATMCLQEQPTLRPLMTDVVNALAGLSGLHQLLQ